MYYVYAAGIFITVTVVGFAALTTLERIIE
jgi:hypothetical protein